MNELYLKYKGTYDAYRLSHREQRNAYQKQYNKNHREQYSAYHKRDYEIHQTDRRQEAKQYYQLHREEAIRKATEWGQAHRDKRREYVRRSKQKLRQEVLSHYAKGEIQCACCGEKHQEFLTIDHMNNEGAKHRRSDSEVRNSFYCWLKKKGFPEGYQILCFNCNWAKAHWEICPHQIEQKKALPIIEVESQ
jgi:hypothetical protein